MSFVHDVFCFVCECFLPGNFLVSSCLFKKILRISQLFLTKAKKNIFFFRRKNLPRSPRSCVKRMPSAPLKIFTKIADSFCKSKKKDIFFAD